MDAKAIKELTVKTTIHNMVKNRGYVDICAVKECLNLLNITPCGDSLGILNTLHCVHFKDMPRELQAQIPDLLRDVFAGIVIDVSVLEDEQSSPTMLSNVTKFFGRA